MHALGSPFGYFDEYAREFVITRPDTSVAWMNPCGVERLGGILSTAACRSPFDRDPAPRPDKNLPTGMPGLTIFLDDMDSGDDGPPTAQPSRQGALDGYECRHGAGYTRITGRKDGITASVLTFIPPASENEDDPVELWTLTLRNDADRPRRLRSFCCAEFSIPVATGGPIHLEAGRQIVFSETVISRANFPSFHPFIASSLPPTGFNPSDEELQECLGGAENPHRMAAGSSNIAWLSHAFTLQPGQEARVTYLLGISEQPARIPQVVERFRDPAAVDDAFAALRADWDAYLSRFPFETPDPAVNAMLNFWLPVLCRAPLSGSRLITKAEAGLAPRDLAQETLGSVHSLPGHTRRTLEMLWKRQVQDGHGWPGGEDGGDLVVDSPDRPQGFGDDGLWLVIAMVAYLRETGDFHALETVLPYRDGEEDSVFDHMRRALQFTLDQRGPHGLPCTGSADGVEPLNIDSGSGKVESVLAAQMYCRAALDLADLCDALEQPDEAAAFRGAAAEMAQAIEGCAWMGEWYASAAAQAQEAPRVALDPQTWAVLGECAPPERARQALRSAYARLNTPFGLAPVEPPTSPAPTGRRDTGDRFWRSNSWAVIAAARLGWTDLAWQGFRRALPLLRKDSDRTPMEAHEDFPNLFAPAWLYVAGTQYLLGIRPTFRGLQIDPRLPRDWPGFSATRVFRDQVYLITVERVGPGDSVALEVNGRPVAGNVVPFPLRGSRDVIVRVRLGV